MPLQRHKATHDHARCIQRAVATAEKVCAARRVNLTPLRKRIFEIVWRQHEPIGAYEILAELSRDREKAAPPTVYRALEFLQDAGLVHRLDTLNAFLGCDRPEDEHAGQFLVCSVCRRDQGRLHSVCPGELIVSTNHDRRHLRTPWRVI
jgi:Fur family transcriptional regulator, zinc uptake regulator